jgi:hypothetical protein
MQKTTVSHALIVDNGERLLVLKRIKGKRKFSHVLDLPKQAETQSFNLPTPTTTVKPWRDDSESINVYLVDTAAAEAFAERNHAFASLQPLATLESMPSRVSQSVDRKIIHPRLRKVLWHMRNLVDEREEDDRLKRIIAERGHLTMEDIGFVPDEPAPKRAKLEDVVPEAAVAAAE